VSVRKAHEVWIEQCEATQSIKLRYGVKAAFDYVVGEKLLNFANAASRHPEFGRELPRFVAEVRRMFTPEEIRRHMARLELEQREKDADVSEEDDALGESPATAAERVRQFMMIKEFLTAAQLGTS
jgi:hypothetical protein